MNNIDKLEKEYQMLEQTLDMYNNTLNEMLAKNVKSSSIKSVEEEINSVRKHMNEIVEMAKRIYEDESDNSYNDKCSEMAQKFIDDMNVKNGRESVSDEREMPLDASPIKINNFMLRFPNKYKIHPYMIDSIMTNCDNTITCAIREFENEYPILPVKLDDMKDDAFDLSLDILNSNETLYYTALYENCRMVNEYSTIIPYSEYNNSNIRLWNVTFKYDKITYLTALPNVKVKNETTD